MFSFRSLLLLGVAVSAGAQAPVGIRVLLGATETESTSWDGGVLARGATIVSIEPWRFEGTDALDGSRWRISTHPARRFGGANQGAAPPVVGNGVIITLSGPDSTDLEFETAQVSFQIRTDDSQDGRVNKTSDYYVRGEQEDGQIVWASPMWITYSPKP